MVLGADRQPCQSPPSLLSHGHGGAPTRTPAGCQPSGRSTCGSTAATAWVVERGTTISRHGHSPRRPDRCWSRPDQGFGRDGGTRPPMAQPLVATPPATVRCQGPARPSESLPATLLVTASPRRVDDPRRRVLGDGQALGSEDPAAVGAVGAATSTSSPTRWPTSAWGNGERTEIRVSSRGPRSDGRSGTAPRHPGRLAPSRLSLARPQLGCRAGPRR
jgi:hypothetical protein